MQYPIHGEGVALTLNDTLRAAIADALANSSSQRRRDSMRDYEKPRLPKLDR